MAVRARLQRKIREIFSVDVRSLAALRIGLGLTILFDLVFRIQHLTAFYTDFGLLPRNTLIEKILTPWHFSLYFLNGSSFFAGLLIFITAIFSVGMLVGYHTRLMTFLTWLMLVSLDNRNPLVMTSGDNIVALITLWGVFLPLGAFYSIDQALDLEPPDLTPVFSFASVGIMLQIAYVYIFVSLHKTGQDWVRDGTAIYYALAMDQLRTSIGEQFLRLPLSLMKFLTFSVLDLQFYGPFLFFIPWRNSFFRILMFLIFTSLQIGFGLCMHLGLFPWISVVATLPFLPGSLWDWLALKLKRRTSVQIYFDQECNFCRKAVSIFGVFLTVPRQNILIAQSDPKILAAMQTAKSWVVMDSSQNLHCGFDGFIEVMRASLTGFWLVPVLNTGFARLAGEKIYRLVGDNRSHLSKISQFVPFQENKPRLGPIRESIAGLLVLLMTILNLLTIAKNPTFSQALKPISSLLLFTQRWEMFSPNPIKEDGWYIIPGKLRNGKEVDLEQGTDGISWERPETIADLYPTNRWQKYMMNIYLAIHGDKRKDFAYFLCRDWNSDHQNPLEQVLSVEIIYMRTDNLPEFQKTAPKRVSLGKFSCP